MSGDRDSSVLSWRVLELALGLVLLAGFAPTAFADGGNGGPRSEGGIGGVDSATGSGVDGASGTVISEAFGGGGGGAGVTGGNGGTGRAGAGGGLGATTPGGTGGAGTALGAGGGGGAHGFVGTGVPSAAVTGGAGGIGFGGVIDPTSDAGGGGAGGWGAVLTGNGSLGALGAGNTITGGAGGAAGLGSGGTSGGDGGSGGNGLAFSGTAPTLTIDAAVSGGIGGSGGSASGSSGSNGNGGVGGAGVIGTGVALTVTSTVTGGNGGAAGASAEFEGPRNGGAGGAGIALTGGSIVNSGSIEGGSGGNGLPGAGGIGVVGSGLTVTNSGTISGGLSGDGLTRANAITFTGSVNSLIIASTSAINGNVAAFSTADTFGLGGSGNASFDMGQIGAAGSAVQYQGFGNFQKSGTSTWMIAGMPSTPLQMYQLNGGALSLGSAGALGTSGTISFGGGTLQYGTTNKTDYSGRFSTATNQAYSIDTNNQDVTYLSAFGSQGSSLTKLGVGTLMLAGANTYTGATIISQGRLALGGAGSIASSSGVALGTGATFDISATANGASVASLGDTVEGQAGAVVLGSRTLTITAGSAPNNIFSGVISGSGGIVVAGGFETLSGANTYSGNTTVTGGSALQIVGSILNSRVINVDDGSNINVFNGAGISLLSQVTLSGAANINLLQSTQIGSLNSVSDASTISLSTGTILTTGTNNTNDSFAGTIGSNGSGSLTKVGTGTFALTGTNGYTGGTTISNGTLQLGNGGTTGSIVGNVTNNANLAFNRSNTYQFDGVISGTGNVQQNGTGTTILTAANTYTGATTINAGTLQVDGSIASPNVTVNNGGTLLGVGKIGDPQINAGGTLSPGNAANPTGTLTIVGPLGFAVGSFYNVAITPTANSRTNVTGVTTIAGGTVQVLAGSGTYATNQRYTILTSTGGVAGTFTRATANTNFAFLTPTLSYDANDVYVTVLPSAPIVTTNPMTGAPTTVPNYRTAAGTQNQLAVASGLTQAGIQSGGTGRVLTALNQLTTPQARAAFDALSGEGLTAAQNIANRSAELFTSSIFDQTTFYGSGNAANSITLTEPIRELGDLPTRAAAPLFVQPNRTWRAWATGFGGQDNIHGNSQIGSSYQQNTIYGGTLGVDYQLMPNYLVGVAIGGTNGDFLVPGRATSGSTTGGHVAFYDLATFGSFYGASSTSFSYFGNRATRTVSGFGGLNTETERANFNSNEFRSRLEFGRHLAGYGGVLTPFVALELAELRSNGFTESAVQGAGLFRLNVSGQSQASAPAFVGVRLQRATSLGNGITLSPTLQVAYVHEFAPYRSQIGTIADLQGSTFLVDGARPSRNAAQVKAGAEMAIGARSVIFANFDGEFSGVNQLYAGKGGFRYLW